MQKLLETLAKYGVTVPQEKEAEIKAALSQHYKNAAEVGKKIAKLELERDGYKEQAENSAETLKSFEGVDLDKIKEELENWKTKAADAQKEMEKQLYDRDFADALRAEMAGYKFTSEAAKRDVMSQIRAEGLKLSDGKIVGLGDIVSRIKEKDATAFVDEGQQRLEQNKAKITGKHKPGDGGNVKLSDLSLDERIRLKNSDPELYAALKKG